MIGTALPQVTAVVRGGIEPPTFRFSGARTTVSARFSESFAVLRGLP
jgi:hypothetical protein